MAGHGDGERLDILEKIFLVEKWRIWWKEKEGKKKERGKRKRNEKREDIFSNLEFENIGNISSRVKVRYAENISEKYRNRPKFKYLGTTRKFYQKSIII